MATPTAVRRAKAAGQRVVKTRDQISDAMRLRDCAAMILDRRYQWKPARVWHLMHISRAAYATLRKKPSWTSRHLPEMTDREAVRAIQDAVKEIERLVPQLDRQIAARDMAIMELLALRGADGRRAYTNRRIAEIASVSDPRVAQLHTGTPRARPKPRSA